MGSIPKQEMIVPPPLERWTLINALQGRYHVDRRYLNALRQDLAPLYGEPLRLRPEDLIVALGMAWFRLRKNTPEVKGLDPREWLSEQYASAANVETRGLYECFLVGYETKCMFAWLTGRGDPQHREIDAATDAFMGSLWRFITEQMRLSTNGEPPEWALRLVLLNVARLTSYRHPDQTCSKCLVVLRSMLDGSSWFMCT